MREGGARNEARQDFRASSGADRGGGITGRESVGLVKKDVLDEEHNSQNNSDQLEGREKGKISMQSRGRSELTLYRPCVIGW